MAQMEAKHSDSYDSKQWDMDNIIFSAKDQGAKQYQEDSTCIFTSRDLTVLMGAVFDGHGGLNGQVASNTATAICKQWFETVVFFFRLLFAEYNNNNWYNIVILNIVVLHINNRHGLNFTIGVKKSGKNK